MLFILKVISNPATMLTIDLHRLGYRTMTSTVTKIEIIKKGLKGIFKQLKLNSFLKRAYPCCGQDSNKENRVKLILLNLSLL